MDLLKSFFDQAIQFFTPSFCASCSIFTYQADLVFCSNCDELIDPIAPMHLKLTDKKIMTVYAASNYADPIKKLILAKGRSNKVASKQLAQIIWQKTVLPFLEFDYFVPIPLHWRRYAARGYNQAEVMAYDLAKQKGKPVIQLIKRNRATNFQSSLKADQRAANIQNAFVINERFGELVQEKRVMLVDDLLTTGATLQIAAKQLLKAKVSSVSAVVAARVV